jgi:hypothetical protein
MALARDNFATRRKARDNGQRDTLKTGKWQALAW